MTFSSFNDFQSWKNKIEQRDITRYVIDKSGYKIKDGNKIIFYDCHRSYSCNKKKKGKISRASKKIGKACPSRIRTTHYSDGVIKAIHWKTHVGHENLAKYIPLDQHLQKIIKDKILAGVADDVIISSIRSAAHDNMLPHRASLITRKDIWYIKKCVSPISNVNNIY
ncbi:uncharacterized protein LOC113373050 [Ctenocephalides felis]|uniref:uncharacterized protein LOC113373050 n=1 Tax=Ctenocephalides felis TaxID=7515 RepID=UPI000E6E24AA|nr:uncharacterized protein LOC113373050 [Ctenocephalides felis]